MNWACIYIRILPSWPIVSTLASFITRWAKICRLAKDFLILVTPYSNSMGHVHIKYYCEFSCTISQVSLRAMRSEHYQKPTKAIVFWLLITSYISSETNKLSFHRSRIKKILTNKRKLLLSHSIVTDFCSQVELHAIKQDRFCPHFYTWVIQH
jgi:hypothetical protein